MFRFRRSSILALGVALVFLGGSASAQSQIVAWGDNSFGQCNVPVLPSGLSYVQVSAGMYHTVARRSDGTLVAWGYNFYGQCDVKALGSGLTYVDVSAGGFHTLARLSDGSVVAWGDNTYGQCDVPALPMGLTCVGVAAGGRHNVVRLSDGSVIAWGDNFSGQCNVPSTLMGLTCVEMAAGYGHSVVRLSDGSLVAWGSNLFGQCNLPALTGGLSYVEVAAGAWHTLARLSDGSVVARGLNEDGQCFVPALPSGLTYTALAAGCHSGSFGGRSLALRSDGSVVSWGLESGAVPSFSGLDCIEIAAGGFHKVGRFADADCNQNSTRDDVDIQLGSSLDCDGNGIPDECDLIQGAGVDCDGNGQLDSCELASDPALDLNHDGRLDACALDCQPFWQTYIGGQAGLDDDVYATIVYDDGSGPALYVGGAFQDANGVPASGVAKWDGATWSALGSGISGAAGFVDAFAVFDDGSGPALFAGGSFSSAGGVPASNIARWDGSAWTALGSGASCTVEALATFDDGAGEQLYMSGCDLDRWDGTSLTNVPIPFSILVSSIYALLEHDDGSGSALYLGGTFAGSPALARWNGASWTQLPAPGGGEIVSTLAQHTDLSGESLYAGTGAGSTISTWDGSTWTAIGQLFEGLGPDAYALTLCSFDDGTGSALFVGGRFNSVEGVPASNVAKWDGERWSGVAGVSKSNTDVVWGLCPFDDGSGPALYAGGSFTSIDGRDAHDIASRGLPSGCVPPGTVICEPGVNGTVACPCSNPPSSLGRGCDNSSSTGGANLSTTGFARLGSDSLVLTTSGEKPVALSIVLQGGSQNSTGQTFGQGVRCVSAPFKRLYMKNAIAGSITAPGLGDASISTRSAALGAPIQSGMHLYYGVYYRDPTILGGCPASSSFNMTQQVDVLWHP